MSVLRADVTLEPPPASNTEMTGETPRAAASAHAASAIALAPSEMSDGNSTVEA